METLLANLLKYSLDMVALHIDNYGASLTTLRQPATANNLANY